MAAAGSDGDDGMITGINVTPLVDIMLVLLIVFMATARLIERRAIALTLPAAATGVPAAAAPLAVSMDAGGLLALGGAPITEDELRARLPALVAGNANLEAAIDADRAAPHGRVVHLIDLLRQGGVERFALDVDPDLRAAPLPPPASDMGDPRPAPGAQGSAPAPASGP